MELNLNSIREFAITAHADQQYGDKPYSFHLDGVAELVKHLYLNDEDLTTLTAIAYLHDYIEDVKDKTPDEKYDDILKETNKTIADVVKILTHHKDDFADELEKAKQREEYLQAIKLNPLALKVKTADAMFNLQESIKLNNNKWINRYIKTLSTLYN